MMKREKKLQRILGGILLVIMAAVIFGTPLFLPRFAVAEEASPAYPGQTKEGKAETEAGKKAEELSPTSGAPCGATFKVLGLVDTGIPEDPVCAGLSGIYWFTSAGLGLALSLAEYAFSWALESNLGITAPDHPIQLAVRIGYSLVLGVANMFFVLILLWIAVATIFAFEPYTARNLLFTLIITALLINFSLPIANAFIGFSNGLSRLFYERLLSTNDAHTIKGALHGMFSPAQLAALARNPAKGVVENCKGLDAKACKDKIYETTVGQWQVNGAAHSVKASECRAVKVTADMFLPGSTYQQTCAALVAAANAQLNLVPQDPWDIYKILSMAIFWTIIIYLIALFVLFAATILLVSRIIVLAFVLILGPAAFLMNILPSTKFLNGRWWENLTKYSFFLPAFMFFFWLGLEMALKIPEGLVLQYAAAAATGKQPEIFSAMAAYLISAAFMVGSLIAASQFGTYGSKMVTGWGQKMSKAAGGWAKGTGKIMGGAAARRLGLDTPLGRAMARTPIARGLLRPLESAAAAGQKVKDQREKAATQRRVVAAKASPDYRRALMQGMAESEQADFIREMKPHQLKQIMSIAEEKERVELHKAMKKYDLEDKVRDALPDFNSVVAAETGVLSSDKAKFQAAVNSWIGSATKQELQKFIDVKTIRDNEFFRNALEKEGVVDFEDFKTMGNSKEKAQAMRDLFVTFGAGSVNIGLKRLETSNAQLAKSISASPGLLLKIQHGVAFGKKASKIKEEETPPPTAPPQPSPPTP